MRKVSFKNAIPFRDMNFPDLVFMIPKHLLSNVHNINNNSMNIYVYMQKGIDCLLSLELDPGTELMLVNSKERNSGKPRMVLNVYVYSINIARTARQAEVELRFSN